MSRRPLYVQILIFGIFKKIRLKPIFSNIGTRGCFVSLKNNDPTTIETLVFQRESPLPLFIFNCSVDLILFFRYNFDVPIYI